ncbi:MAG: hypothetical protein ACNYPG_02315 [Candidatus Porifericomitaceae bacterium WSBS_2022_MAG_OTU9]
MPKLEEPRSFDVMPASIVMVKKIMADGSPCRKCAAVEQRINDGGYSANINETIIADERDPESAGMKLAAEHGIDLAPFFIIYGDNGDIQIYESWLRLEKEVLRGKVDERDEAMELIDQHSDLSLL